MTHFILAASHHQRLVSGQSPNTHSLGWVAIRQLIVACSRGHFNISTLLLSRLLNLESAVQGAKMNTAETEEPLG